MRLLRWLLVVPRAVIAFVVVAWWLTFRKPDDHPFIDEADEDADR